MKFITSRKAISLINNNDNIIISSFGNFSVCKNLLLELRNTYLKEKKPNNLTIITSVGSGNLTYEDEGLNIIAQKHLVKNIITSHLGMCKKMAEFAFDNCPNIYMMPLGVYLELLDSITRKKDGVITKIGLNTFCDPNVSGKSNYIKRININNNDYLYYQNFSIDICFIKAKLCDKKGNISFKKDEIINDSLEVAMASKSMKAKVIVEVEEVVDELDKEDKYIPNTLVDYIVISKYKEKVNPVTIKLEENRIKCAQKAYLEASNNDIINIGVGMPDAISYLIDKDNNKKNLTITIESGIVGGNIKLKENFGTSSNYDYRIRMSDMLKLYNTNFLDVAFLGAAQIDKNGNVNVSKFRNRCVGAGGFIDIVSNAKKIVFLTSLLTKNNEKKFINEIEEITFSSKNAILNNQEVLYITNICSFKLTKDGLELIEIDKNIDIEKDILNNIGFKIKISNNLKKGK